MWTRLSERFGPLTGPWRTRGRPLKKNGPGPRLHARADSAARSMAADLLPDAISRAQLGAVRRVVLDDHHALAADVEADQRHAQQGPAELEADRHVHAGGTHPELQVDLGQLHDRDTAVGLHLALGLDRVGAALHPALGLDGGGAALQGDRLDLLDADVAQQVVVDILDVDRVLGGNIGCAHSLSSSSVGGPTRPRSRVILRPVEAPGQVMRAATRLDAPPLPGSSDLLSCSPR